MSLRKTLKNLVYNLKDQASVIVASLSLKRRHVSSVRVHVLRATTHTLSTPPSESRIAAVLSAGHGSHLLPRATINFLMDRLHRTRSATVALKCLFTLHNVISKGSLTLKDNLSHYPSRGGHNSLNLSNFRDDSDLNALELSAWVRWYAVVLEQVLTVSRVLGYYLSASTPRDLGVFASGDLLRKIQCLVYFVEHVSHVPGSLHLQRIDLVYEVVRLVGEDYASVQREIRWRVEEVGKRVEILDVEELREFVSYMKRLEECREWLVVLFVNRKKNDELWDLIGRTKNTAVAVKEEMEGKWVTVVTAKNELTRFTNPFLDPGQLIPVPPGGAWSSGNRSGLRLTVPTVG